MTKQELHTVRVSCCSRVMERGPSWCVWEATRLVQMGTATSEEESLQLEGAPIRRCLPKCAPHDMCRKLGEQDMLLRHAHGRGIALCERCHRY